MPGSSKYTVNFPGYNDLGFRRAANLDEMRRLRSIDLADGDITIVEGHTFNGDGAGGLYSWSAASTLADNDGGQIKPFDLNPGDAGCWLLVSTSGIATNQIPMDEVDASTVATPVAGKQTLFIDKADNKLKRKDSAGDVMLVDVGLFGLGVSSATQSSDGHLIIIRPDGTQVDVGLVRGVDGGAATIALGTVATGAPGSDASAVNVGNANAALINLTIPAGERGIQGEQGIQGVKGDTGPAATVAIGNVITGAAGSQATVTNSGTSNAATLNFVIPKGDQGAQGVKGDTGAGATVTIGTVSGGLTASVTNTGTSTAAVLNFTIPKGDKGDAGPVGPAGPAMTDAETLNGQPASYFYPASNPSNYLTGITSGQVTGALGFTPYNATNPNGFISGINSGMVTTAVGFTPANKAGETFTGQVNGTSMQMSANTVIGQYDFYSSSAANVWYNAGWRNDGTNVYLLFSNSVTTEAAAQTATWNAKRPFTVNLSSGAITLDSDASSGTTIGGTLGVNGTGTFNGAATFNQNVNVAAAAAINFGSTTRQMLNLWGSAYGIGVQGSTIYLRTSSAFNVYAGGVHSDTGGDAGAGGTKTFGVDSAGSGWFGGNLTVNNAIYTGNSNGRSSIRIGDDAWLGDWNIPNGMNLRGESDGNAGWLSFGGSTATFGKGNASDYFRAYGDLWVQNWFRAGGDTGLYWETRGRGLQVADGGGASYGTVCTYGAGLNGWQGYAINGNDMIVMSAPGGGQRGIYSPNFGGWLVSYDNSGNATFPQNVTAYSDERLKQNIRTIDDPWTIIDGMKGIRYERDGETRVGLGAQTTRKVLPEVVFEADDLLCTLSVNYGDVVGPIIEALKDAHIRIQNLENK